MDGRARQAQAASGTSKAGQTKGGQTGKPTAEIEPKWLVDLIVTVKQAT